MGTEIGFGASVLTERGSLQAGLRMKRSNCGLPRRSSASGLHAPIAKSMNKSFLYLLDSHDWFFHNVVV